MSVLSFMLPIEHVLNIHDHFSGLRPNQSSSFRSDWAVELEEF